MVVFIKTSQSIVKQLFVFVVNCSVFVLLQSKRELNFSVISWIILFCSFNEERQVTWNNESEIPNAVFSVWGMHTCYMKLELQDSFLWWLHLKFCKIKLSLFIIKTWKLFPFPTCFCFFTYDVETISSDHEGFNLFFPYLI